MSKKEKQPETELAIRLRSVRKMLGDEERGRFAKRLGIHKNTLGNYELGINEPTASILKSYNETLGVDLCWLITGKGSMFEQGNDEKPVIGKAILDRDVMKRAVKVVEKALDDRPFSLDKKAELVLVCYDMIIADQSEENMTNVIKLVNAA